MVRDQGKVQKGAQRGTKRQQRESVSQRCSHGEGLPDGGQGRGGGGLSCRPEQATLSSPLPHLSSPTGASHHWPPLKARECVEVGKMGTNWDFSQDWSFPDYFKSFLFFFPLKIHHKTITVGKIGIHNIFQVTFLFWARNLYKDLLL